MKQKYLTDDKDLDHNATMVVSLGGNGDWYQHIEWVDHKGIKHRSPAVRYCTSGGCSTNNPKLLKSVSDQYHSIKKQNSSTSHFMKTCWYESDGKIVEMEGYYDITLTDLDGNRFDLPENIADTIVYELNNYEIES